jgi:hypothetical protein
VYIPVYVYQLLCTHGAKVAPSFFKSEKGGEEGSCIPLLATAFFYTKYWGQWSTSVEQQLMYSPTLLVIPPWSYKSAQVEALDNFSIYHDLYGSLVNFSGRVYKPDLKKKLLQMHTN